MPSPVHYSERMAMGWSCAEIYNVVADVSQYSEFMPLCKKSEVMSAPIRSPSGQPPCHGHAHHRRIRIFLASCAE